jgi:hypothetical protein
MKISPKTKATVKTVGYVALFGLAAVVLVKIYKTADKYEKLADNIDANGLRYLLK